MSLFKALDLWNFREALGYAVQMPDGTKIIELFSQLCDKVSMDVVVGAIRNSYTALLKAGVAGIEPDLIENVILHRVSPAVIVPDEERIMLNLLDQKTLWIKDWSELTVYGQGQAKAKYGTCSNITQT